MKDRDSRGAKGPADRDIPFFCYVGLALLLPGNSYENLKRVHANNVCFRR